MRTVCYDEELYPNLFLFVAVDVETREWFRFEISPRRDDRHRLILFLKTCENMIGFNNIRFDYPVLHTFIKLYQRNPRMKGRHLVSQLFKKGQECVKSESYKVIVKKPLVNQTDLFLINHYDNFARSTNLKILEFNMMMDNIQEIPFRFIKHLTNDEIDAVILYCDNDVKATLTFYLKNIEKINFRKRMSKIYKEDFTNSNDVKIGELILMKNLSKKLGINEYAIKKLRTFRKAMYMSEIIFPYIQFESHELNVLLKWWKDKIIFETRGQFTELDMKEVDPLLPYCNNETTKGKLKNLNIIVNNFQFDFGTGGLHGACYPGMFKSDDNNELILIDVSSYYPNLASKNKLHPKHIDKEVFVKTIDDMYQQRMDAKDRNDGEMVAAIKLALNGALYGKSNSRYSFMYDPQFMMSICVNGQLLLAMIAEKCMFNGIKVIQVNTDGVMVLCPKDKRSELDNIVKWWMDLTKLKLDYDHFNFVVQRDVNNYFAQYTNGNMKYKGAFDYNYAENHDWHKNFSALVIPKSMEAYFMHGIPVEDFITNHDNLYDFFLRTKYGKDTKLVQRTYDKDGNLLNQQLLQNVTRYFVSKNGKEFIKIMQPLKGKDKEREFKVEANYLCTEVNHITDEKLMEMRHDLNYQYYIDSAYKNISIIEDYVSHEELSFDIVDDT